MISLGSLLVRRIPNIPAFSIFTKSLMTKGLNVLEFYEDKKTAVCTVNCPFYPDRAGVIPMSTVLQLFEVPVIALLYKKDTGFSKASKIFKDNGIFTVLKTQSLKIFPEFYKYMKPNEFLSIHLSVHDVGEKSFVLEVKIHNTENVLLCKMLRILVACDHKLTAVPILPQVLDILGPLAKHKGKSVAALPPFAKKTNSSTSSMHINPRPSDLDIFYHVNNSHYITYMLDAAVSAAKAGVYSNLKQDIAFGNVDEIILSYHKEVLLRDNVRIETWEDEEMPLKICFEMTTNSQLTCQGSVLLRAPLIKLTDDIKTKFTRAHEF